MVYDPPRYVARPKTPAPAETTTASTSRWEKVVIIAIPTLLLIAAIVAGSILIPQHYRNKDLDAQIVNLPQTQTRQILGEAAWQRERLARENVQEAKDTVKWRNQVVSFSAEGYLDRKIEQAQRKLDLGKNNAAQFAADAEILLAEQRNLDYLKEKLQQFESGSLNEKKAREMLKLGEKELSASRERLESVLKESQVLKREYAADHQEEMARLLTPDAAIQAATDLFNEAINFEKTKQIALDNLERNPTAHSADEIAKARESLYWAKAARHKLKRERDELREDYSVE